MDIKTIGQFLIDNAEMIELWVRATNHYRTVHAEFVINKNSDGTPYEIKGDISLYDQAEGHFYLSKSTVKPSTCAILQERWLKIQKEKGEKDG